MISSESANRHPGRVAALDAARPERNAVRSGAPIDLAWLAVRQVFDVLRGEARLRSMIAEIGL